MDSIHLKKKEETSILPDSSPVVSLEKGENGMGDGKEERGRGNDWQILCRKVVRRESKSCVRSFL